MKLLQRLSVATVIAVLVATFYLSVQQNNRDDANERQAQRTTGLAGRLEKGKSTDMRMAVTNVPLDKISSSSGRSSKHTEASISKIPYMVSIVCIVIASVVSTNWFAEYFIVEKNKPYENK